MLNPTHPYIGLNEMINMRKADERGLTEIDWLKATILFRLVNITIQRIWVLVPYE